MILAILGIQIVLGACKTEVIFEPGWVGKWMIYQIDSAYDVWWLDTITVMEVFLIKDTLNSLMIALVIWRLQQAIACSAWTQTLSGRRSGILGIQFYFQTHQVIRS